jgi:hypothetical protein
LSSHIWSENDKNSAELVKTWKGVNAKLDSAPFFIKLRDWALKCKRLSIRMQNKDIKTQVNL